MHDEPMPPGLPGTPQTAPAQAEPPLDLLIVGAGLAGVGAAAEFLKRLPGRRIAVLESRADLGGTWDLFRYPGVRSDSDMFTFGYRIRPWRGLVSMVDGTSIREYVRATAVELGVLPLIRFNRRVTHLAWSSAEALWTVTVHETQPGDERGAAVGPTQTIRARFVHLCTGYYHYAEGYRPEFPGETDFRGRFVHPQRWPQDLDHSGKRIVVIGSGATAVTLVPELAKTAAHVTQLQRSPTYVVSQPAEDRIARALSSLLPAPLLFPLVRWKNILYAVGSFALSRWKPQLVARQIVAMARAKLPPGYDVSRHFKPAYGPWDQRVCVVPDGDLFKAISRGSASIVTDTIERFLPEGIRLASGATLPADIVVTATGLRVVALGGAAVTVDGAPVALRDTMIHRGAMLSGLPNLVLTIGYTNASWTLRADLIAQYVVRLVKRLAQKQADYVVAERDPTVAERPMIDFSSGYVQRALDALPTQGDRFPWRVHQNYLRDLIVTRYSRLADPALHFRRKKAAN